MVHYREPAAEPVISKLANVIHLSSSIDGRRVGG